MEPGVIAKTEAPNAPKEEILDYAVEFDKENSIVQRFVLLNCLYRAIYTVCSLMGDGGVGISNNKVMSRTRGGKKSQVEKETFRISPHISRCSQVFIPVRPAAATFWRPGIMPVYHLFYFSV